MKMRFLPIIVAALVGLTAHASAARVYYLVGLRHVYSIPVLPDMHELDRQAIEEDYAAAVQAAQKEYDTDMASIHDEEAKDGGNVHQVDRDAVQQNLEQAIGEAADKREVALAAFYPECDYVRTSHPEFKVDQDGPYHVIGVETAPAGQFVNVVYYQPYPLYIDVCPFGWYWGRPYAYATWGIQVGLFHSTWISIGAPVFQPMFYGGVAFVVNAPVRMSVIVNRSAWVGGRPPMITARQRAVLEAHHAAQVKANYFTKLPANRPGGSASSRPVSKYSHSAASSTRTTAGSSHSDRATSGASDKGSTSTNSHYGKTGTTTTGSTSRYAHPASPPAASSSRGSASSHGSSSDDKKKGG